MILEEFQQQMKDVYLDRDSAKGIDSVFTRLMDEVKELELALNNEPVKQIANEIADVIAWTFSIANLLEIDVAKALNDKYGLGCSKCDTIPCSCENY
jgi:NTP pyrophosphatase (non-canonical NTP hydrolase)